MEKEKAVRIASDFAKEARRVYPGSSVYLFGSQAKGCAGPQSDIDVAIVIDAFPEDPWECFWRDGLLWEAAALTGHPVEPTVLPIDEPSGLLKNVVETGIRLA